MKQSDALTRLFPAAFWRAAMIQALFGVALAASGLLSRDLRVLPIALVGSLLSWALAIRFVPSLRQAFQTLDLRVVFLLHATRAPIGLMFLWFNARGLLADEFALRAGYGDIAAGVLAFVPWVFLRRNSRHSRSVLAMWNTFALGDIILVVATAQRMILTGHADGLRAFQSGLFPAIPGAVVPLVFVTHGLVFARIRSCSRFQHADTLPA